MLKSVRKQGINALALRISSLGNKTAGPKTFDSVRRFANTERLYLVAVLPAGKARTPAARHAVAECSSHRFARLRCAVQARSLAAAAKLARHRGAVRQLVVVYVRGPRSFSGLGALPKQLRRRILVIAPLFKSFNATAWSSAIGLMAANPFVNMGVSPQTGKASLSLRQFARLLRGGGTAAGVTDRTPPSTPTGLARSSATQSSIGLSWSASQDNVGVAGYRLFFDGKQVGTSSSRTFAFTGLSCGASYTLGVAAYDAAGNVSGTATISSATLGCSSPPPPPPPARSGQMVMAFDLGWDPTSNMPWSELTQADLFDLATENGTGLDTSNVDNVDIPAWVGAAHRHGVQAMISIGGDGDQHWQDACNNTNRAGFVATLVNYAVSHGFDGIDLDIEDAAWSSQNPPVPAMTTCIEAIATAAHAAVSHAGHALWVSADVTTNWNGPWFAPSQAYVDQFNLMTYGDDLATLASDVSDTYDQGLPYNKMVVGVDVADYPEPSGGCGQFAQYAAQHKLMGAFVWAAQPDNGNACMNQIAAAG